MPLDHTIIQGLTASIEALINGALRYDPGSKHAIAAIDDILAVSITGSGLPLINSELTLYFRGQEDGLAVLSYHEETALTHLSGSAIDLMALLKQPANLANSEVTLVGDSALLQRWQRILHQLDIDWEDAISEILGDVAGPLAAKTIRDSSHWMSDQAKEQQRLISEYITEEIHLTPSQAESDAFFQKVSHVKNDVDRLEARLQHVQYQLQQKHQHKQDTNTTTSQPPADENPQ